MRFPVLLCLALSPAVLRAADPAVIPGESRPTGTRLQEARKDLAAKKWAQGIGLLLSVLESSATDLVPLDDGRSVQARLLCHQELARIGAEGLEVYRKRVDPAARKALESALRDPSPAPLVRLVEDAFCSTPALDALDRLGDLAFERGRFAEAEAWWRLIAPLGDTDRGRLAYPDPPPARAARVRAKQLLARLFSGRAGFESDLAAYREKDGKAAGNLAGRKGNYADILEELAKARSKMPVAEAGDWLTFAGSPSRNRVLSTGPRLLDHLSQLGRSGPAWRFDLERRAAWKGAPIPLPPKLRPGLVAIPRISPVATAQRMAFHPVVAGDEALVADARYVTAYNLRTGKPSVWYDLEEQVGGVRPVLTLPGPPDLRYTLTVAEDSVFARLGTQSVRDVRPDPRGARAGPGGESVLVSLALRPRRGSDRQRWLVRAFDPGRKDYSVFEGAPLVDSGRVYIAASRFEGDRLVTAIRCYPANPEDTAPLPLWRTDVCETRELLSGPEDDLNHRRYRHHLLTLAGSHIVYCSHSGAVVAVDARSGQRVWALRYPRREGREPVDDPGLRDLAPCLFANGKVYAAPADSDTLFCLDPLSGEVVWKRQRMDVVHLLGVGQGRLIFTTWRNPRQGSLHPGALRAVGADDGGDKDGWLLPDDGGGLTPLGRGLLVGDLVLWPTARKPNGVFAIRQSDGRQADNPTLLHCIPSGNLVWANGCLLVADAVSLWAFVPPERLPDEAPRRPPPPAKGAKSARLEEALRRQDAAGWQALLRDGDLLLEENDVPRRAADVALSRLASLPGAQAEQEKQALALVAKVEKEGREKVLDRLAREVPLAPSARKALAGEALALAKARRFERAAWWWGRLVATAPEREALAGLATAWEEMSCPAAARVAWSRLVRVDPARRKDVAERLKGPRFHEPGGHLSLPLHAVSLTLPAGERFLPPAVGEGPAAAWLWSWATRGDLVCRFRQTGELRWRRPLSFEPTWLSGMGHLVVAAGPGGAEALDGASGERLWSFAAPAERLYPASPGLRVPSEVRPAEPLADFQLAGDRLLLVQGGRALLALDVLTGRTLWLRRAPGAGFRMPAPHGRLHHVVPVGADHLLAQSSGQCWLLDAEGRLLHKRPDAVTAWPRRPLPQADGRVLVVPDSGQVECLEADGKKLVRWAYTLPGKTTRTGEPPRVVASAGRVVLVVPENLGTRLVRLDPGTGKVLWRGLPQPDVEPAGAWLVAGEQLYQATRQTLRAWALTDGKRLWRRDLPESGPWQLAAAGQTLLAWPARSAALTFRFRWLSGSVQWRISPWPGEHAVLGALCLDARSGELVQRLNLPLEHPTGRVERSAVPAGLFPRPEAGLRDDAAGPALCRSGGGLILGLGRQVRVLSTNEPSPSE
jgi:outer membrane protein assembly factor BamB